MGHSCMPSCQATLRVTPDSFACTFACLFASAKQWLCQYCSNANYQQSFGDLRTDGCSKECSKKVAGVCLLEVNLL